jgi:hypothetical protein
MELKNDNREWLRLRKILSQRAVPSGVWAYALRIPNRLFGLICTNILAWVLIILDSILENTIIFTLDFRAEEVMLLRSEVMKDLKESF